MELYRYFIYHDNYISQAEALRYRRATYSKSNQKEHILMVGWDYVYGPIFPVGTMRSYAQYVILAVF